MCAEEVVEVFPVMQKMGAMRRSINPQQEVSGAEGGPERHVCRVVGEKKKIPYCEALVHFRPTLHQPTDTLIVVVAVHRALRRCRTLLKLSLLAYRPNSFERDGEVVVRRTIMVSLAGRLVVCAQ